MISFNLNVIVWLISIRFSNIDIYTHTQWRINDIDSVIFGFFEKTRLIRFDGKKKNKSPLNINKKNVNQTRELHTLSEKNFSFVAFALSPVGNHMKIILNASLSKISSTLTWFFSRFLQNNFSKFVLSSFFLFMLHFFRDSWASPTIARTRNKGSERERETETEKAT